MEREGLCLQIMTILWQQEPIKCQFLGITIYIAVYGICVRHFLTYGANKEGNY